MFTRVSGFIITFKYWLIALLVLLPVSYMKGCTDGENRKEGEYNKVSADIQKGARKASETTLAEKQLRDQEFQKQQEELKDGIVTKSNDPVGRNTTSVLDRMREQQSRSNQTTR